jgi:putrescine transport system ATP-binding protein
MNMFESTITSLQPGRIGVHCEGLGADLVVDDAGRFGIGQRVCLAVRPEKIRLSKTPWLDNGTNCLKGVVWELGYLGNQSVYRIRTSSGAVLMVSGQNRRRTAEWGIDWSDEVYASFEADACILLTG